LIHAASQAREQGLPTVPDHAVGPFTDKRRINAGWLAGFCSRGEAAHTGEHDQLFWYWRAAAQRCP
jgi:hypothetical protein